MKTEQGLLRVSIAVTIFTAGVGILFGILSGSFAIVFDGVYAMTDAAMTVVALLVSNLIASSATGGGRTRYGMGPMQPAAPDNFTPRRGKLGPCREEGA